MSDVHKDDILASASTTGYPHLADNYKTIYKSNYTLQSKQHWFIFCPPILPPYSLYKCIQCLTVKEQKIYFMLPKSLLV